MKIASFERTKKLIASGQILTAEHEAKIMILENPSHFAGYLCFSYCLLKKKNIEEARFQVEQALHYHPFQPETYCLAAEIYYQLGNTKRMTELAAEGLSYQQENGYFYFILAEASEEFLERRSYYQQAIEKDSTNPLYLAALAQFLAEKDVFDPQIKVIEEEFLEIKQTSAIYYAQFAEIAYKRGDYKDARKRIAQALKIEPENPLFQKQKEDYGLHGGYLKEQYNKIQLFIDHLSRKQKIKLGLFYLASFAAIYFLIGAVALLFIIVPVSWRISTLLVATRANKKMSLTEKYNRYIRLPILVLILLICSIFLGISIMQHAFLPKLSAEAYLKKQIHLNSASSVEPFAIAEMDSQSVKSKAKQTITQVRDLIQNDNLDKAQLLPYIEKGYISAFLNEMTEKQLQHDFMTFKLVKSLSKNTAEYYFLGETDEQKKLIIELKQRHISQIYGAGWSKNKEERSLYQHLLLNFKNDNAAMEL